MESTRSYRYQGTCRIFRTHFSPWEALPNQAIAGRLDTQNSAAQYSFCSKKSQFRTFGKVLNEDGIERMQKKRRRCPESGRGLPQSIPSRALRDSEIIGCQQSVRTGGAWAFWRFYRNRIKYFLPYGERKNGQRTTAIRDHHFQCGLSIILLTDHEPESTECYGTQVNQKPKTKKEYAEILTHRARLVMKFEWTNRS